MAADLTPQIQTAVEALNRTGDIHAFLGWVCEAAGEGDAVKADHEVWRAVLAEMVHQKPEIAMHQVLLAVARFGPGEEISA